jgi:light-regulated signal transduction histidine kinase (bacteriophytochrome)
VVLDETGNPVKSFGIIQDITKRKMDEELLHRSENTLERKNQELLTKNKELEQFAYVASHDLQEPLKTTSSFVNLLHRRYKGKLDEQADQYLHYISKASERMQTLIKDLLDYSLIGSKENVEHIDCNKILEDVTASLQNCIKNTHAVIRYSPLPVINGYNEEIKDLFLHLMSNALKFKKPDVTPLIRIGAMSLDEHWQFFVQDNGIGIDEQYMERIFVIFQRLHNRSEYEGSGIGLSHCRKIVELHNGKIWLESSVGKGTTFYFTISKNLGTQAVQTGSEQQASKKLI